MNRAALDERGESFHEALGREAYLTGAGLKTTPEFQAIYRAYADLVSDEALEAARASGSPRLYEWIVDVRVGRAVAPLEERQLAWEHETVLHVNGAAVPYLRVPIEIGNTADRGRRMALDTARVAKVAELAPLRGERFTVEHDIVSRLGFADYVQGMTALSGIDLDELGVRAGTFLDATADMYREVLGQLTQRRIGAPAEGLVRSDAAWVFRADQFDRAFPPERLVATATRQIREMGLDATCDGRVRFDAEERDGKQPRAFCAPVRVPEEVYLVLRPRGGHYDYQTFWHELGHAMHFGSAERTLPFEARWLGDNSVTEGFAMLYDHLPMTPEWLARYTDLSAVDRAALAFELAVGQLYLVRRYAGKLRYELELHRGDLEQPGPAYVEYLTAATGFRYLEGDALLDVDPGFYAARYLRAWQLEAAMSATLTQRHDVEWFRNPQAGAVVREWMGRGQRDPANVLAGDACGATLGFDAVQRRLEGMLG